MAFPNRLSSLGFLALLAGSAFAGPAQAQTAGPPGAAPAQNLRRIDFNRVMGRLGATPRGLVVEFALPETGEFKDIDLSYARDGAPATLRTRSVRLRLWKGRPVLRIQAFDGGVRRTKGHAYTVYGTVRLVGT